MAPSANDRAPPWLPSVRRALYLPRSGLSQLRLSSAPRRPISSDPRLSLALEGTAQEFHQETQEEREEKGGGGGGLRRIYLPGVAGERPPLRGGKAEEKSPYL
ncbi:unnamed protein product [Pleuronectes platessa]|uniref:Uncharacterized protein n=1 Tax=Pleuronectes platessa TaxID=8262 RepID=A0A9N7V270_PLEPL|nr:unnamed protein product [Pleuronectes platessa]